MRSRPIPALTQAPTPVDAAGLIGPMTEYAAPVLFALLALIAAFVGIQRIQTLPWLG